MWKPDYVTVAQLRAWNRTLDALDDAELQIGISAASRAIDRRTRRQFGQVEELVARRYTPEYRYDRGRWAIVIDDLMDSTDLDITLTDAGAVTVYDLEPVNAAADEVPWTQIMIGADSEVEPCGDDYEATVTALWGWAAVPDVVVNACLIQASRFSNRRDSPYGVAGSPEQGNELRLLAKVDPDVAVMLEDVRRYGRPR